MHREATADGGALLYDSRGYRRADATLPGFHAGRAPRNKGRRYPPTAPTPDDVARMLEGCADTPAGRRHFTLIIVLYATGLRISEALKLEESDLDREHRSILIREGKGKKTRRVGMNQWGWTALDTWLHEREQWPIGPVFCIIEGKTAGGAWDPSCARRAFRRLIAQVGIRKHISPHAMRHGFTVESGRRGRLELVQRQLGHASLDHTVKYFAALDDSEVVDHFAQMPAPVMSVPNRR